MRLRKLCDKDISFMLEWMLDEEINCYFRFDISKITYESTKEFIRKANESKNSLHLAITNDSDEYYGTVSLKDIDPNNKKAEYAISTRKIAKHKGYGRFATKEILRVAFEELNLEKVYLNVLEENFYAINFYEKCGFHFLPGIEQDINIRGNAKRIKWFEIKRSDYQMRKT